MWEVLRERHAAGELVLFGTCAGAILLGGGEGEIPPRLGLLDAVLARNAYGRQLASFVEPLVLDALGPEPLRCIFIRAPAFVRVGPRARVLGRRGEEPILVEGPGTLAATFHPELAGDLRIHRRFLAMEPSSTIGAAGASRARESPT
jgi:5'-phosphate synthase pdxT subunit